MLDAKLDQRKNGDDCAFNGYLEDYLDMEGTGLDPVLREAFSAILEKEPETRLIVDLKGSLSTTAISNQIIRYKDVFKLAGKPIRYPYILYRTKDEEERALLVLPYSEYGYIYAKGLYYCMTEMGSEYIEQKNEIVSLCSANADQIVDTYNQLFEIKAGALQRGIDRAAYQSYEVLKQQCIAAANELSSSLSERLAASSDKQKVIYETVIDWFLLKKVLYVQYMMNKSILRMAHDGNVKRQRNQAKLHADDIKFISYSDMWRIATNKQ